MKGHLKILLVVALALSGETVKPEQTTTEIDKPEFEEVGRIAINNRRYLGNKFKLVDFIRKIVDEHCVDVHTFVDIFAGTGSVASVFPDKRLILNDILFSNHICHLAWFSGEPYSEEKLKELIRAYNDKKDCEPNYMSENFGGTYFSDADCRKIGFVREDIEMRFKEGRLNGRERALLITSLLYAMDKIANTVGHYDAYRKNAEFTRKLELRMPTPPPCERKDNMCFQEDANVLISKLGKVDVLFMDPPYNSRQYSDAYHLLENVAQWRKPDVKGVARKMDRSAIKSDYCTGKAEAVFADLVAKADARYIILTYNNMESKGNDRSNAKLSDEAIFKVLREKGDVQVFTYNHRAFSAGKSVRTDNVERIFLCTCRKDEYVASPLNYTGGKLRILDQLLPQFPTEMNTFVDLFCGGANVGINVSARKIILQDSCAPLIELFRTMQHMGGESFTAEVEKLVSEFQLSDSSENGYAYYGCESSKGLAKHNKESYCRLREHYVRLTEGTDAKSIALYVLIVYGFNNQIRFNGKGEFNLPVGKRDFNKKMRRKLLRFAERLQTGNYELRASDFRQLKIEDLGPGDFVYADPPYLVTTATYNENGGWTVDDERELLSLLDRLDAAGCGFALSNVTESNGKRNEILLDWMAKNIEKYRVIPIERDYSNSNYQRARSDVTHEIVVTNIKR